MPHLTLTTITMIIERIFRAYIPTFPKYANMSILSISFINEENILHRIFTRIEYISINRKCSYLILSTYNTRLICVRLSLGKSSVRLKYDSG